MVSSLSLSALFDILPDIFLPFVESIEFAALSREVVVDRRKLFLEDFFDLAVKLSYLVLKFFSVVVFRELNFYSPLFIRLCSDELVFEARDECVGTDLELIVLSSAAFELSTVFEESLIVENDCVVHSYFSVCVYESRVSHSESVKSVFNVPVRNFDLRHFYFYALVSFEMYFRLCQVLYVEYDSVS